MNLLASLRLLAEAKHSDLSVAAEAAEEIERLERVARYLQSLLAVGSGPCIHCGLDRERLAECKLGFPGCERADDMMHSDKYWRELMDHEAARDAGRAAERDLVAAYIEQRGMHDLAAEIASGEYLGRGEAE